MMFKTHRDVNPIFRTTTPIIYANDEGGGTGFYLRTIDAVESVKFGGFEKLVPDSPDDVTKRNLKAVGDLIDAFYSAYVLKLDIEHPNKTGIFGDLQTGSILTASD